MILIYYLLITFSIIGYGFLLSKILKIECTNYGYLGLLGLSFLIFISYSTTLFYAHGYKFNIAVLLLGLLVFFYLLKLDKKFKINLKQIFATFFILTIFILVSKNHDDFPYYHFPYTHILTQMEHPIGLGLLNNGFRNPSSIFFLSSLFYLPNIEFYLLHISPVYFLGFANIIFYNFIIDKKIYKNFKSLNFLSILFISFINIFFYRLAEHGTDRSGMILIFLITAIIFLIQNSNAKLNKRSNLNLFYFCSVLMSMAISLKPLYLIYSPLILLLLIYNFKDDFLKILKSKTVIYCILFVSFVFLFNFINSSCLIYPAEFTCFSQFSWSLDSSKVKITNQFYELWAKAGATPDNHAGIAEDRAHYISGFNWVSNWIHNYFFNKVSDYLLSLTLFIIIFWYLFTFNFKKKKINFFNIKFKLLYVFFILCLFEWFFKHPALRYGGYHIIAILCFIPLSIYFINVKIDFRKFMTKTTIMMMLVITIFISRNINRLVKENKLYNFNPLISYKFNYDKKFYNRYFDKINKNKTNYKKTLFLGKEFTITKIEQ